MVAKSSRPWAGRVKTSKCCSQPDTVSPTAWDWSDRRAVGTAVMPRLTEADGLVLRCAAGLGPLSCVSK